MRVLFKPLLASHFKSSHMTEARDRVREDCKAAGQGCKYGLNRVPLNSYIETLTSSVTISRDRAFGKVIKVK